MISLPPVQLQLPGRLGNGGPTLQEYYETVVKLALTQSQDSHSRPWVILISWQQIV